MVKPTGPPDRHVEGEIRIGWRMGGLGMEVAAQVGGGALLGWAFDAWRGTEPVGLLVGAIAGILVGLWTLVRGALKLNRLLDRAHPTAGRGRPIRDDDAGRNDDDHQDRHRSAPPARGP